MRILHVLGKLDRGGAETWLVQTLRHIDRSQYQFDFLVHTEEPGAYDDEVRALGARIIPCLSPSNPVKYARNFLRILKEYGPYDCVHSHVHHFSGYVLALAKAGGIKARISHSHNDTRTADSQRGPAWQVYRRIMMLLLDKTSTTGLAVSDKAAQSLFGENWRDDGRWHISHLGMDFEPFLQPVDRVKARAELGIPRDVYVIGHVGRFFPQKNHTFLTEIAKQIVIVEPKTLFILIGDGPLRSEIEMKVKTLRIEKHVKFLGVRNDVPWLMKAVMDAFLFPSLFEGFGMVVMEAQAAGLPCFIADNIPSEIDILPELVHRLTLSCDPSVWAEAVVKKPRLLSERPPHEMSTFSIDAAVGRVCSFYDNG